MRRPLVAALAMLALASSAAFGAGPPSWTTYGSDTTRDGEVDARPASPVRAFVLPLPGRITGQVLAARGLFFAVTSSGRVEAFDGLGSPVWQVELGQFAHPCPQLDGYGNTGTPVIDAASSTLYVADGFGRLHALSLATGAERRGWPVRVYDDPDRELDWGALTLYAGAVYVPAASYCDQPMVGGVYRLDVRTKRVTHWVAVPAAQGGGGGVWGWGGLAATGGSLFAATANALEGGSNTGSSFSESAGYGEHLVRLSAALDVQAADHPADLAGTGDLDFIGSPVVIDPPGCGLLVVAAAKDNHVWAWRPGNLAAGPVWRIQLEPYDAADPLLSQLAWSHATSSLYAVTGTSLTRVTVSRGCDAVISWRKPLGTKTENGSPTIAGGVVWFAVNARNVLAGYDAKSGARVASAPLGGTTLSAPTVAGGRLVVGTFTGLVQGFGSGAAPTRRVIARSGTWTTRPDGVFAGGRRIYPSPAQALAQVSSTTGAIVVGVAPDRCMCHTRALWTRNGGRGWRLTRTVAGRLVASSGAVWWWSGGALYRTVLGQAARRVFADPAATVVDAAPAAGGVAALLSSRVDGKNWDTAPRVVVVRGTRARLLTLPAKIGQILVHTITVRGSSATVTGTDFGLDPVRQVVWRVALG
jgi:hypothetical protein